jgi:hypothetical protein
MIPLQLDAEKALWKRRAVPVPMIPLQLDAEKSLWRRGAAPAGMAEAGNSRWATRAGTEKYAFSERSLSPADTFSR